MEKYENNDFCVSIGTAESRNEFREACERSGSRDYDQHFASDHPDTFKDKKNFRWCKVTGPDNVTRVDYENEQDSTARIEFAVERIICDSYGHEFCCHEQRDSIMWED